jgi:DNA-binding response OmpR family regulator
LYKVLIVEDDRTIAELLEKKLGEWGFAVSCVSDFDAVMADFNSLSPHLVLLDISLPSFNGFYWCREIRKVSNVPIVFLSSRTENMDIVMAMNMGGDDYITKPFPMDILVAKIQAILRRSFNLNSEPAMLEARGVVLDLGSTDLVFAGTRIELTKNEFKIIQLLLEKKNRVVTREQIMQRLWDSHSFIDDNTLTVNVNRLRRKLEDHGIVDFVATKKGLGYMIND